jgi:hypothetical protein
VVAQQLQGKDFQAVKVDLPTIPCVSGAQRAAVAVGPGQRVQMLKHQHLARRLMPSRQHLAVVVLAQHGYIQALQPTTQVAVRARTDIRRLLQEVLAAAVLVVSMAQ